MISSPIDPHPVHVLDPLFGRGALCAGPHAILPVDFTAPLVWLRFQGTDIQAISPAPRQICGRYPDRFVGLGTVPFQAPELAIAELQRLHKSLGFRGIEIMHPDGFTEAGRSFAARVDRARKTPRQRFRSRRQAFEQHLPLSSILWDFDIQQACSIAAEDRPALVIIEP
jgi:hypothetical protein